MVNTNRGSTSADSYFKIGKKGRSSKERKSSNDFECLPFHNGDYGIIKAGNARSWIPEEVDRICLLCKSAESPITDAKDGSYFDRLFLL